MQMCFTLKLGFMTEISPKYCNIKAITCLNNDFQLSVTNNPNNSYDTCDLV